MNYPLMHSRIVVLFPDWNHWCLRKRELNIYYLVAPIKALCSERYEDWKKKFESLGIVCKELTGDSGNDDLYSIKDASLIVTTPVISVSK